MIKLKSFLGDEFSCDMTNDHEIFNVARKLSYLEYYNKGWLIKLNSGYYTSVENSLNAT